MKSLLTLFESHNSVIGCKIIGEQFKGYVVALIETVNAKILVEEIQASYYSDNKKNLFLTDDLDILVVPSLATTKGIAVFDP